jgi:hypothetical protein
MTFDALSDVELQRFEDDVLHRPGRARKTLAEWSGLVWYQDRYGERYVTASTAAISSVFATAALVLAFQFLDGATSLTSDRAFGFIAGVSGGLVVATIQLVFAITTGLTERVAQSVEWAGFHPDSDWHLLGALNPRHRRRLRHAHLRRAAEVVLRPSPNQPTSRPPAQRLTTRLSRAYRHSEPTPRR